MRFPQPKPSWIISLLHLAHAALVFGGFYLLSALSTLYLRTAPADPLGWLLLFALIALGIVEVGLVSYLYLRRQRIRRLWKDGERLARAGRFEESREALVQLSAYIEYQLTPEPLHCALAAASEGLNDTRAAMLLYRRCGDYPPALVNLGVLALQQGLYARAVESFRRAMARMPGDSLLPVMLAMAHYRAGNIEAARSTIKARLALRPNALLYKQNLERLERGEEPSFSVQRPNAT